MSYPQGNYPTRNFQPTPQQMGYPQQNGYPAPDNHGQGNHSRIDQSYDNPMNNSMSQQPLKDDHHRGHDSSKSKKKIEEVKNKIAAVDSFTCINWCGVCFAVSSIIVGLIMVIVSVAVIGKVQQVGCNGSLITDIANGAATSVNNALGNTTTSNNTASTSINNAFNQLDNAFGQYSGACTQATSAMKGILIGIGITLAIFETITIFGHCIGISALKNHDSGKMNCAHTFYVIFLVLSVIGCNIIGCILYYVLMTKAAQLKELMKELEHLKSKK